MGACHQRKVFFVRFLGFTSGLMLAVIWRGAAGKECPVSSSILYAYPEGDVLKFSYEYDPFRTNIDLLDKLLTKVISDDDVECKWEVRAKEGHHAEISLRNFGLQPAEGNSDPDCLKIYDGDDDDGTLLAELCGKTAPANSYDASDRSLYLVFTQGERVGHRFFELHYKAKPRSKAFIIKIASIASGVVAAVVICFLAFRFTHGCRPCRKQCCPDEPRDHTINQRELQPLTPHILVPPSVVDSRGDNLRNEELSSHQTVLNESGFSGERGNLNGAGARANSAQNGGSGAGDRATGTRNVSGHQAPLTLTITDGDVDDEDIHSPPPDEPPPSYDSIFGDAQHNARK